jgi:hypothetical protein
MFALHSSYSFASSFLEMTKATALFRAAAFVGFWFVWFGV